MREIFTAKIFWTIAALIAIVSFVIGINMQRTFRSEVEVLLLPKNEVVSKNMDAVLENSQKISQTLKFYDQILTADEGIEDASQELPDYKRKQYWNSRIKIERLEKSHILLIGISNDSQFQASLVADQAAHTLGDTLSQYYNIRTELETRIIDGPVISSHTSLQNIFSVAIWSLIIGIFLSFVFFAVNGLLGKISFPKKTYIPKNNPFTKAIPQEPDYLIQERKVEPLVKKAPAPSNLPFDGEIFFDETPREEKPNHIFNAVKEIAKKNSTREASAEEVKARLNRLLRGDM